MEVTYSPSVHYRAMILSNSKVCRKLSKEPNVGDCTKQDFNSNVGSVYLILINVLHLSISAFTNTSFTQQQTTIKSPFTCTTFIET